VFAFRDASGGSVPKFDVDLGSSMIGFGWDGMRSRNGQGRWFKGRQFTTEVILWAVRWHLMFPISYRDLELMLLDRGVEVDHTTIFR
jgi:hypothetical protein